MNGKWLPYIFTSCPGGAGLQVHSASPFLEKAEIQELENAGRYEPPPSANPTPQDAELGDFPVRHGFLRFSTGRFGFFKSQYVGKESNSAGARYGNYVVEAFVRSEGLFPECPALYLDSPSFRNAVAFRDSVFKEGDIQRPLPLEALDDSEVRARAGLTDEELQHDFSENEAFYAGVLDHAVKGRRLVLEQFSSREFLRRFEGLHRSVPEYLAYQLTGVSYTQSSSCSASFFVQATAEPLPNYVRQEFTVKPDCVFFDNTADIEHGAFVRFIVESRLFSWENAAAFFEFIQSLNHEPVGKDLDWALLLWQLLQTPGQPCLPEDFGGALELGANHGTHAFYVKALDRMASEEALSVFFIHPDLSRSQAMFHFICAAVQSGVELKNDYRILFFSKSFLVFLETDSPHETSVIVRFMIELDPCLPAGLIADPNYDEWAEAAATFLNENEATSERRIACFQAFAEGLTDSSSREQPAWLGRSGTNYFLKELLQSFDASVTAIDHYFKGLSPDAQFTAWLFLAEAVAQNPELASGEKLIDLLGDYFDSLTEEERQKYLRMLFGSGHETAAFTLLTHSMFKSPQNLGNCLQLVFQYPSISQSARIQAVKASLDFLTKRADFDLFCEIVLRQKSNIVSLGLEKDAISAAASICPIPPWTPEQVTGIKQLYAFAHASDVDLASPLDVAGVLCDAKSFPPTFEQPEPSRALTRRLEAMNADLYPEYALHILTQLWPAMKRIEHVGLVGVTICLKRHDDFVMVMAKFLSTLRQGGKITTGDIRKTIRFTDVLVHSRRDIWGRIFPHLVETLSVARGSDFENVTSDLEEQSGPLGEEWDIVVKQVSLRIHQREEQQLGRRVSRAFKSFTTRITNRKKS